MKEFFVYTAARFAVFAVCVLAAFGIFWLLGDGEVPLLLPLLLGAILSVTVSAWLLRGLRDDFAATVQARAERQVAARREREATEGPTEPNEPTEPIDAADPTGSAPEPQGQADQRR